ncbi:GH1 family beta-glucosidase [Actomonas aquatica]|uniref:Beta-glucosidase n=1 Tax=Actomonas aquatica TaxID=2866162 RepID=A0ABZ1C3L0_9BACT|nr:GH1 family beta-glucosidase [Opitutus sp. WL0086]WRQ86134.1 GH1 family beta-glucosidase [Opitutus sp. WL0086]
MSQTPAAAALSRRRFLQSSALATGALVAAPAVHGATPAPAPTGAGADCTHFPANFMWGAATSSYQIEGAAEIDGRKPSIWDTFARTPGKVHNGDTGDVAIDHYHRFREDVKLMADLGVKHYRFSIAWPRVIPDGRGALNAKGVDFYKRLLDALQEHGIEPAVTLYHWDLPQTLQDEYRGWEDRRIVDDFTAYAEAMGKALGDRVPRWFTLNEVSTFAMIGYGVGYPGHHAPGVELPDRAALHRGIFHAVLAHGRGVQALRATCKADAQIGIAENYHAYAPIIETEEHIAAAHRAFALDEANASIIMPILTGRYNPEWVEKMNGAAPQATDAELKDIGTPIDILGFNCYHGGYAQAADNAAGFDVVPTPRAFPRMNISWLTVTPEAIYWGIRQIADVAGQPDLPIVISENGCADAAEANSAGLVRDIDRIMYLRQYLGYVQRAVREGYSIAGYFPWSLADNFEWAEGYAKRFGMVHVDFETQKRTPKLSYHWFQEVIRQRRVV